MGTNLVSILSNTERRFRTVESEDNKEYFLNRSKEILTSIFRGGIFGGIASYLIAGDPVPGALSGILLDSAQDTLRLINLISLYKRDEKEYNTIKKSYFKIGLVN